MAGSAYDYSFTSIDGQPLPLSGFKDKGLVVLGVPSNDFGAQEPGTDSEIQSFCAANFGVDFPMTSKVPVTGDHAHPFYRWAKAELGADAEPKWNFHKLLVGKDRRLVAGFGSRTEPSDAALRQAIDAAL